MPRKIGNRYEWGIDEKGQPHDEWVNAPKVVYVFEESEPKTLELSDLPENLGQAEQEGVSND